MNNRNSRKNGRGFLYLILSVVLVSSVFMGGVGGLSPVSAVSAEEAGGAVKTHAASVTIQDSALVEVLADVLDVYIERYDMEKDNITAASLANLKAAIDAAQAIIDEPGSYGDEAVAKAISDLETAYEGLVYKANKNALQAAISAAKEIDVDSLITMVKENLLAKIAEVEAVFADEEATQDEVDDAFHGLVVAMGEAGLEKGDAARVDALVSMLQGIASDGYTDASFAIFSAALEKARDMLANADNYTDIKFDEAYDELYAAYAGLVPMNRGPGTVNTPPPVVKDPGQQTTPTAVQARVTAFGASQKTVYVKSGKTVKLPIIAYATKTGKQTVKWKASKKTVATLAKGKSSGNSAIKGNANSKLTIKAGKRVGTSKITLTAASGKKIIFTVKVVKKNKAVSRRSVKIQKAPKAKRLLVGASKTLKAAFTKKATAIVTWKSSKPGVVKVDAAGKITALKKGKATITMKVGGKSKKIVISAV